MTMDEMSQEPTGLPDEVVVKALADAKGRLRVFEETLADLVRQRDEARQEVNLLEQLLALRRGAPGLVEEKPEHRSTRTNPVVDEVVAELAAAGKPVHISELMRVLEARGVSLPGAGQPANLIALLTRDDRIVRPSRGMYALASAGFKDQPKLPPAKRRRARGSSRAKN
jgi:hypothetical protein